MTTTRRCFRLDKLGCCRHTFLRYTLTVLLTELKASNVGCYYKLTCVSILLYADDILFLAPSITALQQLVFVCESELSWLDINVWKSAGMRVGPRFNVNCSNIVASYGREMSV